MMELCLLIFYSKTMLVTTYEAGMHSKACLVVERDGIKPSSLPFPSVLKHSALVWDKMSGQY